MNEMLLESSEISSEVDSQPDVIAISRVCPHCANAVGVRSRHVLVTSGGVRVYCSSECLRAASAGEPPPDMLPQSKARFGFKRGLVGVVVLVSAIAIRDVRERQVPKPPAPAVHVASAATLAEPSKPVFGPAWPPTEKDWMAEIGSDAWIHPLNGPVRRMPIRDSRVFGAERPGDRPGECRSGHCGVDIGGEVWGEPVVVVHDGVIDRVQRGPNELHGGQYVRVAHRGGTIFTQYFHLAAIPRWITVGRAVKAGDVVGLVGDTGVKDSGPHLHFTISVKPSKELPEQYMDPEPLIAIWPLRIPVQGAFVGADVNTAAAPGIPRGANHKRKMAKRGRVRLEPADSEGPPTTATPASAPAPSSDDSGGGGAQE